VSSISEVYVVLNCSRVNVATVRRISGSVDTVAVWR
jgi:hypothetical protein